MKLFSNPDDQAFFDKNGYLVIDSLNSEEVADLVEYYNSIDNSYSHGMHFHVSLYSKDKDLKVGVIQKLESTVYERIKHFFVPSKMVTGSFVVKEPCTNCFVPPHQDWSFTDSSKYNSVNVWTALQDTNIENGTMAALPGSHKWKDFPRASPSPGFITPYQKNDLELFPYMTLVNLKAGQSIIFENRTLHATTPNRSNQSRLATVITIVQKEAPIIHYNIIPGSKPQQVRQYVVDEDFYVKYSNLRLLEMQKSGEEIIGYEKGAVTVNDPKILTKEELIEMAEDLGCSKDLELEKFLKKFYSEISAIKKDEFIQPENKGLLSKIKNMIYTLSKS